MKSLMNFSDSALTRSEMKNIKGGCGSTCCYTGGGCEKSANYGNTSKESALANATQCTLDGGSGYLCCASC